MLSLILLLLPKIWLNYFILKSELEKFLNGKMLPQRLSARPFIIRRFVQRPNGSLQLKIQVVCTNKA